MCLQLNLRLLKKAPEAQVFKSYKLLIDYQELKWNTQSGWVGGNLTFAPTPAPPPHKAVFTASAMQKHQDPQSGVKGKKRSKDESVLFFPSLFLRSKGMKC